MMVIDGDGGPDDHIIMMNDDHYDPIVTQWWSHYHKMTNSPYNDDHQLVSDHSQGFKILLNEIDEPGGSLVRASQAGPPMSNTPDLHSPHLK